MSKLLLNRFSGIVAVAAVCVLLFGCGHKISMSNYEKVKSGMTESEVEAILGKGTGTVPFRNQHSRPEHRHSRSGKFHCSGRVDDGEIPGMARGGQDCWRHLQGR